MDKVNWVHVIVALIGGGAAGAIINTVVSAYRERLQPVGRRIEVLPVFKHSSDETSIAAHIAITHEGTTTTFNNLYIVDVQVINRGNKNIDEFEFGVTLASGDNCIFVELFPPDRHHAFQQATPITPQAPLSEIDFKLKPFNRRDSYSLKMYIVVPEGKTEPAKIELSSPSPIKFVDMPSVSEILGKAAGEMLLQIGPLELSVPRSRKR